MFGVALANIRIDLLYSAITNFCFRKSKIAAPTSVTLWFRHCCVSIKSKDWKLDPARAAPCMFTRNCLKWWFSWPALQNGTILDRKINMISSYRQRAAARISTCTVNECSSKNISTSLVSENRVNRSNWLIRRRKQSTYRNQFEKEHSHEYTEFAG